MAILLLVLFCSALPAWAASDWAAVNPGVLPPARWGAANAGFIGDFVVFGGCAVDVSPSTVDVNPCPSGVGQLAGMTNDLWDWNGIAWALLPQATSPSPRVGASMGFSGEDGNVLFGGIDASSTISSDTWVLNSLGGVRTWEQVSPAHIPPARVWAGMITDTAPSGTGATVVTMFGGCATVTAGACSTYLNDVWRFSGGDWHQLCTTTASCGGAANRPSARMVGGQMTEGLVLNSGLLFGGYNGSFLSDTYAWDGGATPGWTKLTPTGTPGARFGGSMTRHMGKAILFGGGSDPTNLSDETWTFESLGTGTWKWTHLTTLHSPSPRQSFAMNGTTIFSGLGNSPGDHATSDMWEFTL
jgi:hypothetical protein